MKNTIRLLMLMASTLTCVAQAEPFRDCPTCPEMATLPAGSFQMGAPGRTNEEPVHLVNLPSFAIGKYETTQGEWKALMGKNPSKDTACGDACPVEHVNWQEAQEYVKRLSAKTGKTYRLPTEAEWEYACRAGEQRDYCGGDNPEAVAWYGNEYGGIHKVGQKQANAWGLYDMSGNIWEWTQDCTHADYKGAPADGTAWENADGCNSRILRGGSWLAGPQYSRAVLRFGFSPTYRAGDFGFRVVRTME